MKKMQKWIALLLAVLMLSAIFAGCAKPTTTPEQGDTQQTETDTQGTETANQPAPQPQEGSDAAWDTSKNDEIIVTVINGYYTGRKEGAPITDLALHMLEDIRHNNGKDYIAYYSKNKKGEPMHSTTIAIRSENAKIVGLLCINFYMNTSMFQFLQNMTPPAAQTPDSPVEESYVENVDELIVQAVTEASQKVQNDSAISNANKNKEIVSILYQRGIFNLKDAVVKVAGLMGISKNTVYMHVRNLNHG